jgi:hypothetical protein
MSEDTLDKMIGWAIIVGIAGNLLMCLNLYRQIGDLEYKVYQLDSNLNSAVQSLSRDVWEMKVKQ